MKKNRIATLAIALGLIVALAPAYADELANTGATSEPTVSAKGQEFNGPQYSDVTDPATGQPILYCQSEDVRTTLTEVCVDRLNAPIPKPLQQLLALLGIPNPFTQSQ